MVGAVALSFMILISANILIENNVKKQLGKIYKSYIPLIELGPHLENQFSLIMRGMQDAVAAHDLEALKATEKLNQQLVLELKNAASDIFPEYPERMIPLLDIIKKNYSLTYDVSLRLMQEETGIPIVNAMTNMKTVFGQAKEMLQKTLVFDKAKLAEAFRAVSRAQKTAERLQLLVSTLCLVLIISILIWINRSVLLSLTSLTNGFMRFSEGHFDTPIPSTHDELGEVAKNANLMAKQIQSLVSELQSTNNELQAFSYSVAHDLRAPLRASIGFSNALLEDYAAILPDDAKEMLNQVSIASKKMGELIDGLLNLSRITRNAMAVEEVNLSSLVEEVIHTLEQVEPERKVITVIEKNLKSFGDPRLLKILLANLIGNSWKFTSNKPEAKIEFGQTVENGEKVFFVRDNGAGFDMKYADKLFGTFQRLHAEREFEGTGLGLATVQRIINRHHGKIWAKSEMDKGATFYFNLGQMKENYEGN